MGNLIQTFNGKKYKYFSSTATKGEAKKWANNLRTRDGVRARIMRDTRGPNNTTHHIFTRKK